MALERIPADIRRDGGVARSSDPAMITEIKNAVTIPVMAKARIGHFVEAQILEVSGGETFLSCLILRILLAHTPLTSPRPTPTQRNATQHVCRPSRLTT